jgi:hypothetical protein
MGADGCTSRWRAREVERPKLGRAAAGLMRRVERQVGREGDQCIGMREGEVVGGTGGRGRAGKGAAVGAVVIRRAVLAYLGLVERAT